MAEATILVLDDDEDVLLPLTLLFRRDGHRVLTAGRAAEAFSLLEKNRVAVVIADQKLPDMLGTVFLAEVRRRWPDTIRIILTGYADVRSATAAINDGHVYRYLTKPWNEAELRAAVRDSVRSYTLMCENRRLYDLTLQQSLELRALAQGLEGKVAERTKELEAKTAELEGNLLDVIRLLYSVQDLRDSNMAGHAVRVAEGALWMANQLGLPAATQHDIEIAATLHDIGKLGLPDRVLQKHTASLGRDDRVLVRQSALFGEALLATIPRLRQAARIVRHQAEWFNGQGFPDGLSGGDIPLGSRLLAVADAFEEFHEREWLLEDAGRRFDPELVHLFLSYLDVRQTLVGGEPEKVIPPAELAEGMILTRDLYTGRGLLLATSGRKIDADTLNRIRQFDRVDPIPGRVYARV